MPASAGEIAAVNDRPIRDRTVQAHGDEVGLALPAGSRAHVKRAHDDGYRAAILPRLAPDDGVAGGEGGVYDDRERIVRKAVLLHGGAVLTRTAHQDCTCGERSDRERDDESGPTNSHAQFDVYWTWWPQYWFDGVGFVARMEARE